MIDLVVKYLASNKIEPLEIGRDLKIAKSLLLAGPSPKQFSQLKMEIHIRKDEERKIKSIDLRC